MAVTCTFIAGRPDEKLIAAHWNDVLRLTASVRTGVVSASLMLKRLGAYPRQNGLALALREIGRIERTLFTLDWLEQPALRRQATAELNKGESCNALSRAICFHRLGRLRDRTAEAQQASRERARPGHRGYRVVEHRLPWPRARRLAPRRRKRAGHAPRAPRPARLAAHQPHRRLPLGRGQQRRRRRVQAATDNVAHGRRSLIVFPVRAANRAILPFL
jgi:hypothetical protein